MVHDFISLMTHGQYYYPANSRYLPNDSIVQCDRCLRYNLKSCIGYLNLDLCLTCAHQIEKTLQSGVQPSFPLSTTTLRPYQSYNE